MLCDTSRAIAARSGLAGHCAVLDQGGDVAVVARRLSDPRRERRVWSPSSGNPCPCGKLTKNQIRALVAGLRDIANTLADADPETKPEL